MKDLSLNELEKQRIALAQRSEELSDAYFSKKENTMAGKLMRRKMGFEEKSARGEDEEATFGQDRIEEEDNEAMPVGSGQSQRK